METQMRRLPLALAIVCLVPLIASAAKAARPERPNIILIFTDDQGYGDIGCYGAEGFKTPNLDQMASEGVRFTDFYSNCPVCSGSRTALMTGCHFQRLSIPAVMFPGNRNGLNPNEITVAEVLKDRGYATACIGKWHLGHLDPFLPTRQGFDYYYGIPYSNDMTIDPQHAKLAADIKLREGMTADRVRGEKPKRNWVPLMRGEEVIEYPADQSTLTRRYTEETVKFITQHKDEPFFVYLPHTMPHLPLYVSDSFKGRTKTLFGDIMEEIDWSVGEILKTLKQHDLDNKTLVIFTTDNGTRMGSSGPLRGRKAHMYEGGIRVPCIMRWPENIPAGKVCSEIAATIDILPTVAHLAGGKVPDDRVIDGKNIWPLMKGEPDARSPHEAYCLLHGRGAVRSGPWKFYPWPEGQGGKRRKPKQKKQPPQKGPAVQLYDLSKDLSETTNVAQANPEVVARLQKVFTDHKAEVQKNRRPAGQFKAKK